MLNCAGFTARIDYNRIVFKILGDNRIESGHLSQCSRTWDYSVSKDF